MSGRGQVPRRRGAYEDRQSWSGVLLTATGAILGGVASIGALILGWFALSYASGEIQFGGAAYGCDDRACAVEHMLVGVACLASIGVVAVLAVVALSRSPRLLRSGMRISFSWAALLILLAVVLGGDAGWIWLAVLAVPPVLMGWGSGRRLRAKERRFAKVGP